MICQVFLDQRDQICIMRTSWVQPEYSLGTSSPCSANCQLHPVLDGQIFGLAHTPDVTLLHLMGEDCVASIIGDYNFTLGGYFQGLVMAAIFFSLLGHETNIGDMTC